MSKLMHAPAFVIGVPIRDARDEVIGVIGGVVDLRLPNFLDKITRSSYGKKGSYLLIAPQPRLIVTSTDKSRVMETLPAPGARRPAVYRSFSSGPRGVHYSHGPAGHRSAVLCQGRSGGRLDRSHDPAHGGSLRAHPRHGVSDAPGRGPGVAAVGRIDLVDVETRALPDACHGADPDCDVPGPTSRTAFAHHAPERNRRTGRRLQSPAGSLVDARGGPNRAANVARLAAKPQIAAPRKGKAAAAGGGSEEQWEEF